jgi:mRNA-degrading endonuclease RelE of RelBE toxin-antitoxin system
VHTRTIKRTVDISPTAKNQVKALPARFRKKILSEIYRLEYDADVETGHRHQMTGDCSLYWQSEVGPHRIYYSYDDVIVDIDSVVRKGSKQTPQVFIPKKRTEP